MQEAYSSQNAFLIIEQNDGECPYLQPEGLVPLGTGEYTFANGIVYIGGSHPAPYDSFANLIAASPNAITWCFSEDTGEGRYYDGSQAGDVDHFWPPEKRALGYVQSFKPAYSRPLEFQNSVGDMRAVSINEGTYECNIGLDKTLIDKRRLSSPLYNTSMDELFGFLGTGPLEREMMETGVRNHWYLVILYTKDLSEDINNIARSLIFPCSKFGEIQVQANEGRIIQCTLQGKSTYMKTVPRDDTNIPIYEQEACELKVLIDDIGVTQGAIGNPGGIAEFWEGQEWATPIQGGFDLCSVRQRFDGNFATPADIVCKIYAMFGGAPIGPALHTSTQYTDNQVQASFNAGISHIFDFPSRPTLFPGSYFSSLETVGASGAVNYYRPLHSTIDPYAFGDRWVATNNPWGALNVNDFSADAGTDLRMEIWGLIL